MNRRNFIKASSLTSCMKLTTKNITILTVTGIIFGCNASPEKKESISPDQQRPNILLAIADDMSYFHTSYLGCKEVSTPNIDELAKKGVWFNNAYCSSPSCAPSRGALLTGRNGWELGPGGNLNGYLPAEFPTYTEILGRDGYFNGYTGKGWAPGDLEAAGRSINPAGKKYNDIACNPYEEYGNRWEFMPVDYTENFKVFLEEKPEDAPFCFWFGCKEPHRPYLRNLGVKLGKDPDNVDVPDFWPENEVVRGDILDYFTQIEWFDEHIGRMIKVLKEKGLYDNTIIIITSDNGMPFPRAKANLYDFGTHMPLLISWEGKFKGNRRVDDFVNLIDLFPTFLEATGNETSENISGKSLMNILLSNKSGQIEKERNRVFTFKERHAWTHPDGMAYPQRAIRKNNFMLIWNLRPDMMPVGPEDPTYSHYYNIPFGDCDNSPTKFEILQYKNSSDSLNYYYHLNFGKRPEYELYDLEKDPHQLKNLADNKNHEKNLTKLQGELKEYLISTNDPRMHSDGLAVFDTTIYYGGQGIKTAGMRYKEWKKLSSKEQQQKIEEYKSRKPLKKFIR